MVGPAVVQLKPRGVKVSCLWVAAHRRSSGSIVSWWHEWITFLAIAASSLLLTPGCATPETYSLWWSLPTTGSAVVVHVSAVSNTGGN